MSNRRINYAEYDVEPMNLPNLLATYKKGLDRKPLTMSSNMRELSYKVAMKFPNWRVVTYQLSSYADNLRIRSMSVYAGDEHLGDFRDTYYNGKDAIEIDSERIAKSRVRDKSATTSDVNKAVKLIAKHFGAKTIWENLEESIDTVTDTISRRHNLHDYERTRQTQNVMGYLVPHILENWETQYAETLRTLGMGQDEMSTFERAVAQHNISEEVTQCMRKGNGAVVLIHGNDYCVAKHQSPSKSMRTFTGETLPDPLRAAIGMLKLVEDKHFVSDIGFRLQADTFYIQVEDDVWMSKTTQA